MRRALAIAALVAVAVLPACGSDDDDAATDGTTTTTTAADADGIEPAGQAVSLTTADFSFDMTEVSVPAGTVTFTVQNSGALDHNLTVDGTDVNKDVAVGKTAEQTTSLAAGTYAFHCRFHPDQMKGTITVS